MSGHNKWSQIKNKKGVTDKKRGQMFSKILRLISIAAKAEPNPQFNPRLRSAIETAQANHVPKDNIDRAVNKASETKDLEELTIEAYGPEGSALIIEAITDSKNRTINEIKNILSDNNAKMANPGNVTWLFSAEGGSSSGGEKKWLAKFPQEISPEAKEKLTKLIEELDEHEDIQNIVTNVIM